MAEIGWTTRAMSSLDNLVIGDRPLGATQPVEDLLMRRPSRSMEESAPGRVAEQSRQVVPPVEVVWAHQTVGVPTEERPVFLEVGEQRHQRPRAGRRAASDPGKRGGRWVGAKVGRGSPTRNSLRAQARMMFTNSLAVGRVSVGAVR